MTKKRIFEILEPAEEGDLISKIFDVSFIILICVNIAAVIAASFNSINERYQFILNCFEIFSIIIFTAEYLLRLWTSNYLYPKSKFFYLKFIFSFAAVIDLAAILPFYLPFIVGIDLRFLRVLRVLRMFRIFKLGRYSEAMNIIGKVLNKEKEKLISTIILTIIMIFISATVMYYAENTAQPDIFPNIIETTWWAISTFTTVWYGDYYPITIIGKICGAIISLLGIMIIALPSGIICSGFMDEIYKENKKCPHCGKDIE
jgi:voltage-gated potassium channel